MSDSGTPDQDPKTQPKGGGRPPRPPKITARGLEDGTPEGASEGRYAVVEFLQATQQADRLVELIECIRDSRLVVALNRLEAELDACIVELSKGDQLGRPVFRELAMRHLETIRAYRDQHPRRGTGDRALREQARKILNKIKKAEA